MHSWKKMVDLLERVNRPQTLGFQADMAHTLLYILGYNAPEDAILPADWDWSDPQRLDEAMKTLTQALRPWTIDFHVAQNDATVKGSGTHDNTGHHCLPDDPNGKLTIPHHAGYWLHGEDGQLTRALQHICWDGCMFPNAVMMKQETWNHILAAMIAVRDAHGWREDEEIEEVVETVAVEVESAPVFNTPPRKAKVKTARKVTKKQKKTKSKPKRAHAKTAIRSTRSKMKPAKKVVSKARPKVKSRKAKLTTKKTKPAKRKMKAKRAGARKTAKRKR